MLSNAMFAAATVCGLFISSVQGHMVITSPVPYGESSLNNSPLEPDGSDFPCKQRSGVYDVTTMNQMPVGVPQKLAFKGGATHGGGSCQVSVTLDKQPTKDSDWRVIHSIVGGCPTNAAGNADGSPTYEGSLLNTFEFSVPKGMPNGEYTLAWTWFNKIGNREMYMNCAPITVTGGADNNDVYDTLPSMFKANIPASQCTTTEGTDVQFPNPGAYSETGQGANPGAPSGSSCGASGSGSSGGSSGSPAASSGASPASSAAPEASSPSYSAGNDTGSAAPTAAPGSPSLYPFKGGAKGVDNGALETATTVKTVVASAPAAAAQTNAASAPSYSSGSSSGSSASGSGSSNTGSSESGNSSTSSGSCSGGATSCPTPGSVVCIGSDQWGLCDINNCAVPMALSAGTSCSNGVVAKRHVLEHVRRHAHHARKL